MRTVTRKIAQAFNEYRPLNIGNTRTDGKTVWLHGNPIVARLDNSVWVSLAGWDTPTTRERINGITNAGIQCVRRVPYMAGKPIDVHNWYKVS